VVTAAATDAWGTVKAAIARLLGRGDKDKAAAAERRLEGTRRELAGTAQADRAAAQARVAAAWQTPGWLTCWRMTRAPRWRSRRLK
jgi:hypothetical protein